MSPKIYDNGKRIVPASSVKPANCVIFVDAIFEMIRMTQKSVTRIVKRNEFIDGESILWVYNVNLRMPK